MNQSRRGAVSSAKERIESFRRQVETRLPAALDGIDSRAGSDDAQLAPLREAIEYSLLAPGKRVRPVLVLAAADACGLEPADGLVDVALAFELVHAYSLVHDDLPCMDDDELRRGMPTSHIRYGEDVALLVGDALQAAAFGMVAGAEVAGPAERLEVVRVLADAAGWRGMVGGQYLDVQPGGRSGDLLALREVHDRKTGALLGGAIEAGGVLAGVEPALRPSLRAFGVELGWLFQLVDDLLDEVGDQQITGKRSGSDRRQGRTTAVSLIGVEGAATLADEQLELCLQLSAQLPQGGGELPDVARYIRRRER